MTLRSHRFELVPSDPPARLSRVGVDTRASGAAIAAGVVGAVKKVFTWGRACIS